MVTTRLLRRHLFFSQLSKEQLEAIAEIASQERYKREAILFEENTPAESLYFLHTGRIELFYTLREAFHPEDRVESRVGVIHPGEPFGISALIEPYVLTSTARTTRHCEVIRIEAEALRALLEEDVELAYLLIDQLTRAALIRLNATRQQLAEAWTRTLQSA